MTIPLSRQDGAWLEFGPSQMEVQRSSASRVRSTRSNLLQKTDGFRIKIAESVGLQPVDQNPVARGAGEDGRAQVYERLPPSAPAGPSDRDRANARSRLPGILKCACFSFAPCGPCRRPGAKLGQPLIVFPSLIRYMRPASPASETRFSPSFLRTTPDKNPRTECCCHPVAFAIASIVAPFDERSNARICVCLLSARSTC